MQKVSHLKNFFFTLLFISEIAIASENSIIRLHSEALTSLKARIESIRQAQKEVLIEAFYLEEDEVGNYLLKEMVNQKRLYPNLNVQIVIDAWGSASLSKDTICHYKNLGLQIRQYNPVGAFQLSFKSVRTHRKIWIADDHAFIGGRNLANEHFFAEKPYQSAKDDWDVEIKKSAINQQIRNSFFEMWNLSKDIRCQSNDYYSKSPHFDISEHLKDIYLPEFKQANLTWYTEAVNKDKVVYKKVFDLINKAEKSLLIENAFFIPPEKLSQSFIGLADKNVEINMILNGPQLELPMMGFYTSCLSYFEQIKFLDKNINLYNMNPNSFTHAKAFLIDNKTLGIGSFNLDYRSAEWNSETLLLIENSEILNDFKEQFFNRAHKANRIKTELDIWPKTKIGDEEKKNCESKKSLLFRLKKYF